MTTFLIISVFIILFGGFLYWAYLPDYRIDPKEFWRTLIGIPIGMLLSILGFGALNELIKKWAIKDKDEKNNI
ncbi:hypothetical protein LRR18_10620 [Mangrovimonas sp. AS39]|uniref:hypothetical protein n=1 Tax=Mangrovimonas TaxID=1211036 RepID=UPI0014244C4B|nr:MULTISPECIES: hypothetical protein [Mangrovimonas]MCF1192036.1 hypothetical protein [Mangrovimonas futianensis]MCF1195730.1 hypothetical protein [Mangrovimonas futianensis]NIK92808.1 hypothetical protein [Mangrovimonas sp. CR14]